MNLLKTHLLFAFRTFQIRYFALVYIYISYGFTYKDLSLLQFDGFRFLGFFGGLILFHVFFYLNANFFYLMALSPDPSKALRSVFMYGYLLIGMFFLMGIPRMLALKMMSEWFFVALYFCGIYIPWEINFVFRDIRKKHLMNPYARKIATIKKIHYSRRKIRDIILNVFITVFPTLLYFISVKSGKVYYFYIVPLLGGMGILYRGLFIKKLMTLFSKSKYNFIQD